MRVAKRAALLCVAIAVASAGAMGTATNAYAGGSRLPDVKFHLKTLSWDPHTGNVMVTARVRCTGKGSFRWEVGIQQKVRARASANVPCDGDGFLASIELHSRNGRFHPGAADLTRGIIICGQDVCIGTESIEKTRIPPPGHTH
jgi:hypothetical protein